MSLITRSPARLFAPAFFAVIAVCPSFAAQTTTVWNHNVFGPPRAVTAGIETVAEFLKKESKGTLEIKIAFPQIILLIPQTMIR